MTALHGSDLATLVNQTFADRVAKVRKARAWSATTLSERMRELGFTNIYQTTVSRIELGNRKVRLDEAYGFAEALGVGWGVLGGTEPIPDFPDVRLAKLRAELAALDVKRESLARELGQDG